MSSVRRVLCAFCRVDLYTAREPICCLNNVYVCGGIGSLLCSESFRPFALSLCRRCASNVASVPHIDEGDKPTVCVCVCVCGSAHHPLDVFRWALRAEPHSRHFHAWRTLHEIICTTISHKCHRQLRFLSLRPEIIAYRRLSKLRCIFVNIRFPSCE